MDIKKSVAVFLAGIFVLFMAEMSPAESYDRSAHHFGHGHKARMMMLFKKLDLSDAQKSTIKDLKKKFKRENKEKRRAFIEAKIRMRETMLAENMNETEIRNAFRNASAMKEELMVSRARMFAEVKKVLTPEQIQRLDELKAKRLQHFREKMSARGLGGHVGPCKKNHENHGSGNIGS